VTSVKLGDELTVRRGRNYFSFVLLLARTRKLARTAIVCISSFVFFADVDERVADFVPEDERAVESRRSRDGKLAAEAAVEVAIADQGCVVAASVFEEAVPDRTAGGTSSLTVRGVESSKLMAVAVEAERGAGTSSQGVVKERVNAEASE
jgi:hypothetical protein